MLSSDPPPRTMMPAQKAPVTKNRIGGHSRQGTGRSSQRQPKLGLNINVVGRSSARRPPGPALVPRRRASTNYKSPHGAARNPVLFVMLVC